MTTTSRKTRTPLRTKTGGALAVLAVLTLAGCGSSSGDDQAVGGTDDGGKSPLVEYLGEGFNARPGGNGIAAARAIGGRPESPEEQQAKQRKLEEEVATCMKAAGFEYVAVPPRSDAGAGGQGPAGLSPADFAAQYGYGVITVDQLFSTDGKGNSDDPNTKLRDELSPTAQKAYDKALNGAASTGPGGVVALPAQGQGQAPVDTGCRGKSAGKVYGEGGSSFDFNQFSGLFGDLEALRKRIASDQRVTEATGRWSGCLADAGHAGFKALEEPRSSISAKLQALSGGSGQQPGGGRISGPPALDKVDPAKLAELRTTEIDLAKADQACRAKEFDAAYDEAQRQYEKEFVEQHRSELEQYRDAVAQQ